MIPFAAIIEMIKAFWKPAVATALLIVIAGFVWSWHARGLKLEAATAKLEAANMLAEEWQQRARECSVATLKLEAQNKLLEEQLRVELGKTPVTVIKYRDRVKVVENLVISDDCPTAVAQMAAALVDMPACEGAP